MLFTRGVAATVVTIGLALFRDPGGCGGSGDPSGGENAPCTRTKDCRDSLVCVEGVCVDPNAGDAGTSDASKDAADERS